MTLTFMPSEMQLILQGKNSLASASKQLELLLWEASAPGAPGTASPNNCNIIYMYPMYLYVRLEMRAKEKGKTACSCTQLHVDLFIGLLICIDAHCIAMPRICNAAS